MVYASALRTSTGFIWQQGAAPSHFHLELRGHIFEQDSTTKNLRGVVPQPQKIEPAAPGP